MYLANYPLRIHALQERDRIHYVEQLQECGAQEISEHSGYMALYNSTKTYYVVSL